MTYRDYRSKCTRGIVRVLGCIVVLMAVCGPTFAAVRVAVTTAMLGSLVKDIGGKNVDVHVIMTPGSCPGHYDLSPRDIKTLSASKLVFKHGFEGFLDKAISTQGGAKPVVNTVNVQGSWLIPSNYLLAAKKVSSALSRHDPKRAKDYERALLALNKSCKAIEVQLKRDASAHGFGKINVLCSNQQCDFVEWLGFSVVSTYGRPEELTPHLLHTMTRLGKQQRVRLVVDNLQSGPTAGKQLAKDINAGHVTLSNFPGGFAGTETWSKCVRDNVNRLTRGIAKK